MKCLSKLIVDWYGGGKVGLQHNIGINKALSHYVVCKQMNEKVCLRIVKPSSLSHIHVLTVTCSLAI